MFETFRIGVSRLVSMTLPGARGWERRDAFAVREGGLRAVVAPDFQSGERNLRGNGISGENGIAGAESESALLVQILRIRRRQLHQESADPLRDGAEEGLALLRRGGARVADAGVVGDPRPAARRPRPSLAQPGDARLPLMARAGFREREDEAGRQ